MSVPANGAAPASASAFAKRYDEGISSSRLSASRERTDVTSSTNSRSSSSSSSSRYGVRKRVKSVIQKAKSRKIAKAEAKLQQEQEQEQEQQSSYAGAEDYGSNSSGSSTSAAEDDSADIVINSESVNLSEVADEVNGSSGGKSPIPQAGGDNVAIPTSPSTLEKIPAESSGASPNAESTSAKMSSSEPIPEYSEAATAEKTLPEVEEDDDVQEQEPIVTAEPPPFDLPKLTDEQQRQLDMGERVQFQNDMGREGSGFVVLDVKAPPDVVWECLLDFQSYPETIPTVREVTMYTNTHLSGDYRSEKPVAFEDGTMATLAHGVPSTTRAAFTLSKFRLKIAAIHRYTPHPDGDYMVFTLDPACTNLVLKAAKGVWHTQSNPDNKGEVRCLED